MKINYYLLGFAGLFIFLVSSHFIIIFKYFQILIHHSIYYCLEMAKALNLQLSGDLGRAIVGILALAALFTAVRIFIAIFKVYSFRKYLSGNIIQTRGNVSFFKQRQPQAFCFGILKPKIYISSGLVRLMSSQELAVILRHEKYHLEKKDSLVFLMASLIESLFPFFPVISDFISVYRTDREVEADKIAIRSVADKRSLAEILKNYYCMNQPNIQPL